MPAMPFDPHAPSREDVLARNRRAVALWLILVAAMVWVMVALGGATRLTASDWPSG